ncbi:MAG: hypothetical protein K6F09_08965, partial [Clostridiales bacterium]|nr:hypothetical protein [Clostridiales bacterium]
GDTVYYVSKANNNTGHDPSGGLVWTEIVANDTTTVTNGKIDIKSFYPGEQDVYKMVATVPSSGLFNMIVKDIDVYSGSDPVAVNTPRFTEQTTPKRSEILSCIGLYAVAVDKDGNQIGSTVLTNLNDVPSSTGVISGLFPSAPLSAGSTVTVYYDFFIDGNANQAIHNAIREIGARVIIDKVTIAHVS